MKPTMCASESLNFSKEKTNCILVYHMSFNTKSLFKSHNSYGTLIKALAILTKMKSLEVWSFYHFNTSKSLLKEKSSFGIFKYTFNWDLELKIASSSSLFAKEREKYFDISISLLKLHGALFWFQNLHKHHLKHKKSILISLQT